MKQWMWTIEINTPPTREEFKRRKLLAWADKLYAILTAAACVLATVLAVIGLAYCLGGRPCMARPVELTAYNAGHDTGDRTYSGLVLAAATNFEEVAE